MSSTYQPERATYLHPADKILWQDMTLICQAAHHLELYLTKNVGDNDDWPLHLHCDNPETAKELASHLENLRLVLKPVRDLMAKHAAAGLTRLKPNE